MASDKDRFRKGHGLNYEYWVKEVLISWYFISSGVVINKLINFNKKIKFKLKKN